MSVPKCVPVSPDIGLQVLTECRKRINDLAAATLFLTTRSTYMGGTVPGKANEMTCYAGGVGAYHDEIRGALTGWKGFDTVAVQA